MDEVVDKFGTSPFVNNQADMTGQVSRALPTSDPGSPYVERSFNPGRVLGGRNLSSAQAALQRPVDFGTALAKGTNSSTYDYNAIYGN